MAWMLALLVGCVTTLLGGYVVMFIALRRDGATMFGFGMLGVALVAAGWILTGLSLPHVDPVFR